VQYPAQFPHLGQKFTVEEQFFVPRRGAVDVNSRVETPFGQSAVELELHVAGSLELFEDDLIHLRSGLYQRAGENGERSALFDVARRAKELLGRIQGARIDPAGHDAPGGRSCQVVSASEAGDPVEDDDDVTALLDEALGPLDAQFGDVRVLFGGTVKGRRDDFTLDAATHVGDLFGTFVDQEHHQVDFGVVGLDGLGDLLHDRGL